MRDDLWVLLMQREWEHVKHSANPRLVITDVRFDNEAMAIREAGGTVWRILREGVAQVNAHVSEAGVRRDLIDGDIKNYGTVDELRHTVEGWMMMLSRRYAK